MSVEERPSLAVVGVDVIGSWAEFSLGTLANVEPSHIIRGRLRRGISPFKNPNSLSLFTSCLC